MKRAIFTIGLVILVWSESVGQVVRFAIDGPKPPTLEALIDFSPIIVEATVESAFPVIDRRPLTSDFLIRVNKVVKGNLTSNQIAVHQFGGTLGGRTADPGQYSLMLPGERYILFLIGNALPNLPDRGVPRYDLAASFYGLARIEGSQVTWSKGMPETWRTTYRLQPDQLITAIQTRSQTR